MSNIKTKLIVMNFLQFAVWGSYLTSMGGYLFSQGYGELIGWFYAMQGVVSMFMPAIMGIIADKWIPAQRLLGLCHGLAALFIAGAGYCGQNGMLWPMFTLLYQRGLLHANTRPVELSSLHLFGAGRLRHR